LKVSEILNREPQDVLGYSVDYSTAPKISGEIRRILNLDLDEIDIATQVQIYDSSLSNEDRLAASSLLSPAERRAWQMFVNYEDWRRTQEMMRDRN
jgi:hypothetical protein